MNIGIIGKGFVGNAISEGFKTQGHNIIVHDTRLETQITDIMDCPIVYISVPTPSAKNGDCDVTIVESVLRELYHLKYGGFVCVKSTVKPGSLGKWNKEYGSILNLSFVPEFLREKCAVEDFIGGLTNKISNMMDSIVGPLINPINSLFSIIGKGFGSVKGFLSGGLSVLGKIQGLINCVDGGGGKCGGETTIYS